MNSLTLRMASFENPTPIPIYQVDAFAKEVFTGNPAAVCPLERWLPDETLQKIAAENNLSETAFFVRHENGSFHLRWFTPVKEVDLCGHATLAAAYVLYERLGYGASSIDFHTRSGLLTVVKSGIGFSMDFPSDYPTQIDHEPYLSVFNCEISGAYQGVADVLIEVASQDVVENLDPDFRRMASFPARGFIVTAPGRNSDIVSRCFYPAYGINEDPVTGSAHTTLFSHWGRKWMKSSMTAIQLSKRRGYIWGELRDDRVILSGSAVCYLEGLILI